MVSCQWKLTSGAREGQACGRGQNVFCKTHEPKALSEVRSLKRGARDIFGDYLANKFNWQLEGVISSNKHGRYDYSTSWIGEEKEISDEGLNSDMTRGGPLRQLETITNPAIVSLWLEQELSKVTIRNNQMFPPPITNKQWDGLSNLTNIFSQRFKLADYWVPIILRSDIPEPFFQNAATGRRFALRHEEGLYNQGFILFLQMCIAPSPDYQAVWTWFYPRFRETVRDYLNTQNENYDVEAIEKDLRELLEAYLTDLQEGRYVGPNTNRYRYARQSQPSRYGR